MIRNTMRKALLLLAAALASFPLASSALFRTYLSSAGNDANPCTLQQPCRLLPAALAVTDPGGEVWMLDSANYNTGPVTISQSVTVLAVPGVVGSVVALGGSAITIAGDGHAVILRNLAIGPFPGGGTHDGVSVTGESRVHIQGTRIANLGGDGVDVSAAARVHISDCIIELNGVWGVAGRSGARVEISRSRVAGNDAGVLSLTSQTGTHVSVSDSAIVGNQGYGLRALNHIDSSAASARLSVTRSTIQGNNYALDASSIVSQGSASIMISASKVTDNGRAWNIFGSGAQIRTLGNNHITDTAPSVGSLTPGDLM